jgi:hypothetical protein
VCSDTRGEGGQALLDTGDRSREVADGGSRWLGPGRQDADGSRGPGAGAAGTDDATGEGSYHGDRDPWQDASARRRRRAALDVARWRWPLVGQVLGLREPVDAAGGEEAAAPAQALARAGAVRRLGRAQRRATAGGARVWGSYRPG